MTAAAPSEAKIIAGGPRTRRRWGGKVGSINTNAFPHLRGRKQFDICPQITSPPLPSFLLPPIPFPHLPSPSIVVGPSFPPYPFPPLHLHPFLPHPYTPLLSPLP